MDLDDVLPDSHYVTRQSRWIDAPPEVVWAELHAVRLSGLPVTVVLGAARFLPVLLFGHGARRLRDLPFLEALPIPLLASEEPRALIFGGALQAWRLGGGEKPPLLDAEDLQRWIQPGWVKAVMDFRLTPARGGTVLSTETRVLATDPSTRRRFRLYWLFVQPGSTAIRWEVLTAVQLKAEARGRAAVA
ncbi:MAG: hypothetical protein AVDCRST_MAG52-1942 [uncultured Blastococcus sp.]|uniref:Uncharacterized protein n=1 Tax=uncultured Blastococcus sp. TaxID=217144 RepID=A0A6J4IDA6_9ACTN|nr:MAG: hypothetical protein AVDCRST_MAG52-1942 [uncultured Blastococcus sp.]